MTPSLSVSFMASEAGQLEVRAQMEEMEGSLVEAETATETVVVRALGTVELTLAVPDDNVTVGNTFMVTVGVLEETPLPEGTTLTATISFPEGDGAEMGMMTVELTMMASSAMAPITAPFAAGDFTVEVNGTTSGAIPVVTPASAQVTAVPVVLALVLSGPEAAVTVNQPYQVTVDTNMPVPAGTTLTVTVSAGTGEPQTVMLTADTADTTSNEATFVAPARAGDVEITATAAAATDPGALAVSVPAAATETVMAVADEVQLTLRLEVPTEDVTARDSFEVTVFAEPEVPEGATVMVMVSFDETESAVMELTPGASSTVFSITAPGRLAPEGRGADGFRRGGWRMPLFWR